MRDEIKDFLLVTFLLGWMALAISTTCSSTAQAGEPEDDDVELWLARSCVGEAGWGAHSSGECAALLHIYLKRSHKGGLTLLEACRMYSGATKQRPNHPRKWLFHLDRSDNEPEGWPSHLRWERYSDDWLRTVDLVGDFLRGQIADPLPHADHYGSKYDHIRAVRAGWWELVTDFRNRFYSVDRPKDGTRHLRAQL